MSKLRYLASLVTFSFIIAVFMPQTLAKPFEDQLKEAEGNYRQCVESLPAKARWGLADESARGRRNWSRSLQKKVRVCLGLRRLKEDYQAMIDFSHDLKSLYQGDLSGIEREEMEAEADEITSILINATRELNKKFRMANMAVWHNFLIKIGAREGGYCYQWTEEFFKVLPPVKLTYFERHWGVHNEGRATENNAVVITRPGEPVSSGIVYDAWRGKGEPFWRFVSEDGQKWKERFSEDELLYEQIIVEEG